MMRRALLIADLEGVAGVDSVRDLALGGAGYLAAREKMTREVNACVEGLVAAGFEQVRVSDAHDCGSGEANLLAPLLHPACELRYEPVDSFGGALLDRVQAVACVGMHAGAGTPGFAAHTVRPHVAFRWGGRELDETRIAFWLAAERGVPALYSAGDDVLAGSAGPGFVLTKRAVSGAEAKSLPEAEVWQKLRRAGGTPDGWPEVPRARELVLRFKRAAWADAAEKAGAPRVGPVEVAVPGDGFTQCYERALELFAATDEVLLAEVPSPPGTPGFAEEAARLLLEPFAGPS